MNANRFLDRLSPRMYRFLVNRSPPLWVTGGRIRSISDDGRHWELELRRRIRNLNVVGAFFGGALYASADPHFMLAWMRILGPDYIVWDKQSLVRFRRPGRTRLHGSFTIDEEEVEEVKRLCDGSPSVDRTYHFAWKDPDGRVVMELEQVLYFRKKPTPPIT